MGGHLGRGVGVYWAADLTRPSWLRGVLQKSQHNW